MVQVVQAMLHIRLERRDAEAGHAPPGLTGLTVSWGTPGAHVVAEKGARGTRVGRGVSHSSLATRELGVGPVNLAGVRSAQPVEGA